MKKIGRYEIKRSIAKGGMGEVFLAYDPLCERQIALKCIREDLQDNRILQARFLKEAKITAKLTHPGIITIYSIHEKSLPYYYTMPYVEGKSLRQLLKRAYDESKSNKGSFSIPALMPIFKTLCQTIAYAHAEGILHRDIKPENILVGKYGEVILLDWGVSIPLSEAEKENAIEITNKKQLTSPGKIVGTLAALAPERVQGAKATVQTEIYALGVILYQILTLRLPFHRRSIAECRKRLAQEKLVDPAEKAPYRDVPLRLAKIVKKCLEVTPTKRYATVKELLTDLNDYFEGCADWLEEDKLSIEKKEDWEYQENVMISKAVALTSSQEALDWANMMVSKRSFSESVRIKTRVKIGAEGLGIGFLLSVPETAKRKGPLDGFCLWLSSETGSFSQLLRGNVEVMALPHLKLQTERWQTIVIEKREEKLYCKIEEEPGFTYLSYLPLMGRQIGLLTLDHDFEIEPLTLFVGSGPLQVSCLATPNAFFANRQYKQALEEYRRIGNAFPGHAEGREALFKAGIVLLEQAKASTVAEEKEGFYNLALEEFSKLHTTPGAPYEYLGKAIVHERLEDFSEESKYLELGLRRYKKHPLKHVLEEQVLYRMHECAEKKRSHAYRLITLVVRLMPKALYQQDTSFLLTQLTNYWEPLYFFESTTSDSDTYEEALLLRLSFWLDAPYLLEEEFEKEGASQGDILYALFEMRASTLAKKLLTGDKLLLPLSMPLEEGVPFFLALEITEVGIKELRSLLFLMHKAIDKNELHFVSLLAEPFLDLPLPKDFRILLDSARIWALLKEGETERAEEIFDSYSLELLNQESTLLHPLYGCYLAATENEEIATIHLSGVIETPFPRSFALLGHEITNNILDNNNWVEHSFAWERRQLYRQLELYYRCTGDLKLEKHFAKLH